MMTRGEGNQLGDEAFILEFLDSQIPVPCSLVGLVSISAISSRSSLIPVSQLLMRIFVFALGASLLFLNCVPSLLADQTPAHARKPSPPKSAPTAADNAPPPAVDK